MSDKGCINRCRYQASDPLKLFLNPGKDRY